MTAFPLLTGVHALQCYCCGQVRGHGEGCPVDVLEDLIEKNDRIPRPADHPSVLRRFWNLFEISDEHFYDSTPCHIWTGAKSRGGNRFSEKAFYGSFNVGGEVKNSVRAHVFAAWLAKLIEEIRVPYGMNLDHLCCRSLCVNALHFELVPATENQQRRIDRNRSCK